MSLSHRRNAKKNGKTFIQQTLQNKTSTSILPVGVMGGGKAYWEAKGYEYKDGKLGKRLAIHNEADMKKRIEELKKRLEELQIK